MTAPLDVGRLAVGDRVQHELAVRAREDKVTKNGDPFVVLTVGNASGSLSANVWSEHVPAIQGVTPGAIVQVIGTVEAYQGRRQLKLSAPPRVIPGARADLAAFLPRIAHDREALWAEVDAWRAAMPPRLRTAVAVFFGDDAFRVAFEAAPGATRGHHAMIGGLLLHEVEVARVARAAAEVMGGDVALVTAGALLHDVGKVEAYTATTAGFEFTAAGRLLGHVVLGSLMLDQRLAALPDGTLSPEQRLELHHFIQSHHGVLEFGAAVRPMTLEAELLHHADQVSAKGNDFTEAMTDRELFPGDEAFSVRKSWRLDNRVVWRRAVDWG
jgi:3'-5' exoribonuclease